MKSLLVVVGVLISATVIYGKEEQKSYTNNIQEPGKNDGKLFFGAQSAYSHTFISYTTSTIYFSCLQGVSADKGKTAACLGKRRRKRTARDMDDELTNAYSR